MKCYSCQKEFDILYDCEDCVGRNISYCEKHRYDHDHIDNDEDIDNILNENAFQYEKIYQKLWQVFGSSKFKFPEWVHFLASLFLLYYVFNFVGIRTSNFDFYNSLVDFSIIAFTFLVHELSHKIFAMKHGYYARFGILQIMVIIALIAGIIGFPIAVIGTVFLYGQYTEEQGGKIAIVGPSVNIGLAVIGLISFAILKNNTTMMLTMPINQFIERFISINIFWSGFNLIPVSAFDGWKIFRWKSTIWFFLLVTTLVLFIIYAYAF